MNNFIYVINRLSSAENGIHFYEDGVFTSYATYRSYIHSCAHDLKRQGVKAHHKIALHVMPTVQHTVFFMAIMYIRAIPVSVKPPFGEPGVYDDYLKNMAEDYGVDYFMFDINPDPAKFDSLVPCLSGDESYWQEDSEEYDNEIAFVQFTSGSTSDPKPIEIKHYNLSANVNTIVRTDGRQLSSVGFNFLPLSHDMGLVGGFLSNFVLQNTLHLTSIDSFFRKLFYYLNLIKAHKVAVTAMPNFVLNYIARRLRKAKEIDSGLFSSLNAVYVGAEPIRKHTIEAFLQCAQNYGFDKTALLFSYGLAEATLMVSAHRFVDYETSFDRSEFGEYIACVGEPVNGVSVFVEAQSSAGKVLVSGNGVVDSLATVEMAGVNYLSTGDVGYIREGSLYICGRERELIIINGENIFLVDIENYLHKEFLQFNNDLQIVAVAHEYSFIVFFSSKSEIDNAILDKATSMILRNFAVRPSRVMYLPNKYLLKTTSGKIRKDEILKLLVLERMI